MVLTAGIPDGKDFNQALFAIELYGQSWDFGPLEFSNVAIVRYPLPVECLQRPASLPSLRASS